MAAVVAVVLAVVGGAVGAVVAVGMTQAAWSPFHAEQLEPLIAVLEQERGDRTAELARLEEDRLAAVAAVSVDPAKAASMTSLQTQVRTMETARDAVVASLGTEKAKLNVAVAERDGLQSALDEMRSAVGSGVSAAGGQPPAAGAALATLENSVSMDFVLIPAGQFSMGSVAGDSDEQPVHEVTISQPFYLGVYEVTEADWSRVMGGNKGSSTRPVLDVSWDDAVSFCAKLSALPAERAAGRVYRLPTEAEWEYACRAGTTTAYSFGDDASLLVDFAWFGGNSGGQTHPVGQKKPNPWGLYDMHGNVW